MNHSQKAAICIDNGYFIKLCMDMGAAKVDFCKFVEFISKRCNLKKITSYVYDCMPFQSKEPTKEERERYSKKDKFFFMSQRKWVHNKVG